MSGRQLERSDTSAITDVPGKPNPTHEVEKSRLPRIAEGHKVDAAVEILGDERVIMTDEQVIHSSATALSVAEWEV